MKEKLLEIFSDCGIYIEDENEELKFSSLTFITVIVQIEQQFDIYVPDEYLNMELLKCFSDFIRMISDTLLTSWISQASIELFKFLSITNNWEESKQMKTKKVLKKKRSNSSNVVLYAEANMNPKSHCGNRKC